jgi:HEAT repeat protein
LRSSRIPLKELIEAAEVASKGDVKNQDKLIDYLKNDNSGIRYWGATGLLILGKEARVAKEDLVNALEDESPNVIVVAAEALYNLGEKQPAIEALIKVLKIPEDKARCHALNAIKYTGENGPEIKEAIAKMIPDKNYQYSSRIVEWFTEKWNLKPE